MNKFHLTWDDKRHNLGIASIDGQHRELVDMVNELVDAVEDACNCDLALGHMANIIRFTEEHFAHEEELMSRFGYPDLEKHAGDHKEALRQAIMMMETLKPDDTSRTVLLTAFLTDCAESHIMQDDKELAQFLLGKGLS